jgi:hypothetical protein
VTLEPGAVKADANSAPVTRTDDDQVLRSVSSRHDVGCVPGEDAFTVRNGCGEDAGLAPTGNDDGCPH